jgi:DNA-directed RNA polymerase subunit RPC12/RpoP
MDEQGPDKMWRCSTCGEEFKPSPPDYSCPKCRSNATAPLDYRDRLDSERRIIEEEMEMEAERLCPECRTAMRLGFLVERDSPLSFTTLGEGVYWTPCEEGLIGTRVALKSYACPECGYVTLHLRRLDQDRNTILKAPTRTLWR